MMALVSDLLYGLRVKSGEIDDCFYFTAKPKKVVQIGRAVSESSASKL